MKNLIEITLDFETYYSKKEKYSLAAKGMTIEKYIRNPKFDIIGLAVKVVTSRQNGLNLTKLKTGSSILK